MPKPQSGSKNDDVLVGGQGTSNLAGGQGDDTYIVDSADITISERKNGGQDTVEAWIDFLLPAWVENLILKGSEAVSGTGNAMDNVMVGNENDNVLSGLEGDDTLAGGSGNDTLDGGAGSDTANYEGPSTNYEFSFVGDDLYVYFSPDGEIQTTDLLRDVEFISFEDQTISVTDLKSSSDPGMDPPATQIVPDAVVTEEDTSVVIDVLANDIGENLQLVEVGPASHGTVSITEDGMVLYVPSPDANGNDSFSYTTVDALGNHHTGSVSVDVLAVNDAPVAVGETYEIENAAFYESSNSLLDNEVDPDGDTLSIVGFDAITAMGGIVTVDESGTFTYQPSSSFDVDGEGPATDSFSYEVSDGQGGTSTATVELVLVSSAQDPAPTGSSGVPEYALQALLAGGTDESNDVRWNADQALGTEVVVHYSFLDAVPDYYGPGSHEQVNFQPFTDEQKAVALEAFSQISSFTNISFVETTDPALAQIAFGTADLPTSAWAYTPSDQTLVAGDVWISNTVASNEELEVGGDGYMRIFHEIGHALGLEHPHEGDILPDGEDSREFTMMSYAEHGGSAGIEPSTYQIYDIASLQHLYGVGEANLGDDVYKFAAGDEFVGTIWDTAGHDTIDASAETGAVLINLESGSFSSIGSAHGWLPMENNLSIAFGTTIEDAIGGTGNDSIYGNEEDNAINGGAGNDMLSGAGGADRFSFGADWGHDTITDFQDGVDKIDLTGAGIGFADLTVSETGEGLHLSNGESEIFLPGITVDEFDETDLWTDPAEDEATFSLF